jgi:hypothetical protein
MKKAMMILMMLIMLGGIVFAAQGVMMHMQVDTEEATFHQLQNDYFMQAKSIRDSAETGSQLNKDLVAIVNYPSELMQLKLIGVGKILTGIFVLLFGILIALIMMPVRLGKMIGKK